MLYIFKLLVEQNDQFEDVNLGFGEVVMVIFHYFLTFKQFSD